METSTRNNFEIIVSPDHLQACIGPPTDPELPAPTRDQILQALAQAKVVVDQDTSNRIQAFLVALDQEEPPTEFLLAQGRPPTNGFDGQFIPAEDQPAHQPDESGRIDYRSLHLIRTVEPDTPIGKLVPPIPGQPGVNVYGQVLKPTQKVRSIDLQENVRLDHDGQTVIATTAGRVMVEGDTVFVRNVLEVTGDVNFSVGNIEATSDVSITGNVQDLFKVASEKSIFIGGAVQAAIVEARDCVEVRGGILSRSKGRVRAGNKLTAKFCDDADLQAGQDIQIAKEAVNSRLYAEGKLLMPAGTMVGGETYARQGAVINILGSAGGTASRLVVGLHPTIVKQAYDMDADITKQSQAVDAVRKRIAPLLANLKRLNDKQRIMVTELNYRADKLEQQLPAQRQARQNLLGSTKLDPPATITINKQIHANSVVIIDGQETRFQLELQGPVTLELRLIERVIELVALHSLTGSVTVLKSFLMDFSNIPKNPAEHPVAQ